MNQQTVLYQAVYPAVLDNVEKIITELADSLSDIITAKRSMQIQLAVEEAIVNIISYAYPEADANSNIHMAIYKTADYAAIEIIDYGIAYNPLEAKAPDLSDDLADRKVGGLGIYFIRQVVDKVQYVREAEANKLTLIVNL